MHDVTLTSYYEHALENCEMAIWSVKYRQKFIFKNQEKHVIFIGFLLNMLENDDLKLQAKFGVHITSNIFKIINFKVTGSHQPPDLPTLKAYPNSAEGGKFEFFH